MDSGELELHETKGVNPHISVCVGCGKEVGVVLLGKRNTFYECEDCDLLHISDKKPEKCDYCRGDNIADKGEIPDGYRVPADICDECKDKKKRMEDMINEGGIHWNCDDCNQSGVIRPDHPICADVRKRTGIKAPNPVGVTFNKETCPNCRNN
jgi:hypothetical protein